MRAAINDYKGTRKGKVIDSLCKRATPRMWSDYISASTAIKIIRDHNPSLLANAIEQNVVIERYKPMHVHFFNNARRQVGQHSLANILKHLNDIEEK